eukprot:g56940.t1
MQDDIFTAGSREMREAARGQSGEEKGLTGFGARGQNRTARPMRSKAGHTDCPGMTNRLKSICTRNVTVDRSVSAQRCSYQVKAPTNLSRPALNNENNARQFPNRS